MLYQSRCIPFPRVTDTAVSPMEIALLYPDKFDSWQQKNKVKKGTGCIQFYSESVLSSMSVHLKIINKMWYTTQMPHIWVCHTSTKAAIRGFTTQLFQEPRCMNHMNYGIITLVNMIKGYSNVHNAVTLGNRCMMNFILYHAQKKNRKKGVLFLALMGLHHIY